MKKQKPEELEIEVTESMIDELRDGWEHAKEYGMEGLTFHRYLTACVMLGHHTFHKTMGLAGIMAAESERVKQKEEKE